MPVVYGVATELASGDGIGVGLQPAEGRGDRQEDPEEEHPGTLSADALPTLKFMTDELSQNFIANVRQTFFYKYLARR